MNLNFGVLKGAGLLAVAALLCSSAYAGDEPGQQIPEVSNKNKITVSARLSFSGVPLYAQDIFQNGLNKFSGTYSLSHYYRDYNGPVRTTGVISAGVDLQLKRWVALSFDFGATPLWNNSYVSASGTVKETKKAVALTFMVHPKFMFYNRELIRLYAGVGIGFGKYVGFDKLQYMDDYRRTYVDDSFKVEAQVTPFGMEIGRKLFGYFEIGLGTVFVGLQGGIGYKF